MVWRRYSAEAPTLLQLMRTLVLSAGVVLLFLGIVQLWAKLSMLPGTMLLFLGGGLLAAGTVLEIVTRRKREGLVCQRCGAVRFGHRRWDVFD